MKSSKGKKYKRFLCLLAAALLCCQIPSTMVKADGYVCSHGWHTFGDYTLNGGIGNYGYTNRYYWVSSSFSSTYNGYIDNAVSKWVHTTSDVGVTTPISIVETSTKSDSVFDVYSNYLGANTLGRTEFYKSGSQLSLNSSGALMENYGYTYIHINPTACDTISAVQRQATVAHEFGHAMGLSHRNTVPSSIMCQCGSGRTATRASQSDLNAINHLY